MDRRLFLLLLAIAVAFAQNVSAQLSNEQMGGVYYAYHAPADNKEAAAPKEYKLVYVSHYGRHGSRWVTSDARYEWLLKQFADDGNLTKEGRKAKKLLRKVYANARGNGGQLTPVGMRQHAGIAKRMVERFPSLFNNGVVVNARSSVVNRCKESMRAFLMRMLVSAPKAFVTAQTDSADMRWMSYDSPDEELLKRETNVPLEMSPQRFLANLFRDTTKVGNGAKLLAEMFTIASDIQDVDGVKANLYQFFTQDEMLACYRQSCRKMWHQNGLDPANHGIPAQCAANLLGNIVADADKALTSGTPSVTLRFGHDTALYRLLSLLGSKTVADFNGDNLCDIVPMAANLQMAFYKNAADSVLVAFWLNEKPMLLQGVATVQGTFYSWSVLKHRFNHYLYAQRWKDRVDGINTMVGTAYAVTKSAGIYGKGSEEHGQTLPAVLAPHGMNFWTPQTRDTEQKCVAPYYYPDTLLLGFRASHWIVGGCTQDYGSFTLMPEMGRLRLKPAERATRFSHRGETSHPYYYSVSLPDEHLVAEMVSSAGGGRAAIFRFTPDRDGVMHIVVNPNSDYREGFVAVDTARSIIYGYNPVHRIYQGWGERAGFSGWFVVEIEAEGGLAKPSHTQHLHGQEQHLRGEEQHLRGEGVCGFGVRDTVAFVSLNVRGGQPVLARAATSFTSLDAAIANLRAEMPDWDFLGARLRLDSLWQRQLARIDVDDSDKAKVNKFYGALYRASFLPHVLSDADGSHPAFSTGNTINADSNHKSQTSNLNPQISALNLQTDYYGDYSMWDIYRAQLPLLTIAEPDRIPGIMQSLVTKYEEGGWMPIFPCWNSYTAAMIGDHAAAALADAWVKGVRGFDIKRAYEGVRKNAFDSPKTFAEYKDGMGRRALRSYLRYGYIPMEDSVTEAFHTNEQVSRTLEYAYDDFCAAQLAKAVGSDDDYKELMRRSQNWRNVINPRTGWADGRHSDHRWLGNTDLTRRVKFITEGAVVHYSFYVPQDVDGLVKAMGGRDRFIARLDTLFSGGYYWHGNEPCHQIPYLYALAGEPRKTQQTVRNILATEYLDVPGGLSGNDDAGQMSAWYIFSSLGFYPVCPGKPEYVIGVPSFRRARIGNMTIEAEKLNSDNPFIAKTLWNGKPYSLPVITHQMITRGGTLKFVMGK